MWKRASAAGAAFLTLALSSAAQAGSSDAVVGAIVGAGFGAAIGHSIDGRQGALLGSAIGAVAGTAIANNDDSRDNRIYRDRGDDRGYNGGSYSSGGYYGSTQVRYIPANQPVYAQPVVYSQQVVYTQPVYAQPIAYYPAQPVRVIYNERQYHNHGWKHDRREWRDDSRDDRREWREDRYRDRRWD